MNDRKHRRNTVSTIYLKFKRATYQPRLTSSVDAILFVYKSSANGGQWCHPALLFRLALILLGQPPDRTLPPPYTKLPLCM